MTTQKKEGNQLLNEALIKLIEQGHVSPIDAYMKCIDKKEFLARCERKGIKIPDLASHEAA